MNIQVLKRRLGTSSFNGVFLKICPYNPTSKILKLEIEPDKTFMQNKLKICKTGFLQNRKMCFLPIEKIHVAQNLSYRFFKTFGC